MTLRTFVKDPDSTLDYSIDWTRWLNGDTIVNSTWAVGDGITKSSVTNTTTQATVWLAGGTAGTSYTATNTIITAAGLTVERSIEVTIASK